MHLGMDTSVHSWFGSQKTETVFPEKNRSAQTWISHRPSMRRAYGMARLVSLTALFSTCLKTGGGACRDVRARRLRRWHPLIARITEGDLASEERLWPELQVADPQLHRAGTLTCSRCSLTSRMQRSQVTTGPGALRS